MKEDIWRERAELLRPYSGIGLSHKDIAERVGMTTPTVAAYAKKFGFEFGLNAKDGTENVSIFRKRADALAEYADQGMTRSEAGEKLGLSASTVHAYCHKYGIKFRRGDEGAADEGRADAMAAMFQAGRTLAEIGALYGVSRERVRQIITKFRGVTRYDGGQSFKSEITKAQRAAKREADCLRQHGCSRAQLSELRAIGRDLRESGNAPCKSPVTAFVTQRNSAKNRGIGWNIKLWDWWMIWQRSGKWDQRGRERGSYVMCRFADQGAYELGNVYIATSSHNCAVQPNHPRVHKNDESRAAA